MLEPYNIRDNEVCPLHFCHHVDLGIPWARLPTLQHLLLVHSSYTRRQIRRWFYVSKLFELSDHNILCALIGGALVNFPTKNRDAGMPSQPQQTGFRHQCLQVGHYLLQWVFRWWISYSSRKETQACRGILFPLWIESLSKR